MSQKVLYKQWNVSPGPIQQIDFVVYAKERGIHALFFWVEFGTR